MAGIPAIREQMNGSTVLFRMSEPCRIEMPVPLNLYPNLMCTSYGL